MRIEDAEALTAFASFFAEASRCTRLGSCLGNGSCLGFVPCKSGTRGMVQREEQILTADALRLLDRSSRQSSRNGRAEEQRASARFSHVRRWTQGPADEPPKLEEVRPLLPAAGPGVQAVTVPDDSMVPSRRSPLAGVQQMFVKSTTLSKESEQILNDKSVTLAVVCAGWILLVQGLSGLHGLAFKYFMKEELHVSPATLTFVGSLAALPWVIKPVYGFTSDAVPICGYRRKPYLLLSGLIGCVSWVCMAGLVQEVWAAAICLTVPSLAAAFANVLAEALVVEKSRGHTQEYAGRLQTCIYGGREIGAILSSFTGGDARCLSVPA